MIQTPRLDKLYSQTTLSGYRLNGYKYISLSHEAVGGSVAEWLACWTQAQKGPGSNRSRDAVG